MICPTFFGILKRSLNSLIMRFFLLYLLTSINCLFANESPPAVLVTIAPQKYLVEQIAGSHLEVSVLVPQQLSSHNYEPTIQQVLLAKKSQIWFRIGENFEEQMLSSWEGKPVIDMRERLSLLSSDCNCCKGGKDPHIWLSCSQLKIQCLHIEEILSQVFPQHQADFKERTQLLLERIDALDLSIQALLHHKQGQMILVAHPAFGYFCRDYGLVQLALEKNGKEPSLRHVTLLIDQIKEHNLSILIVQKQHPLKVVSALKKELNLQIIELNPFEENVLENLNAIAKAFSL